MNLICAVTFQPRGRLYYADPGELRPAVGDHVLYPTGSGPEVAQVTWAAEPSDDDIGGLPVLLGPASPADIAAAATQRRRRAGAQVAVKRLVRDHGLPMKLSGVDVRTDPDRVVVYFTAPTRVDFRGLVRDLSATLHSRVELRQLSARDEARLTGGLGSCGRELCCSTFLVDFEPVTVRLARDQELPPNPMRISGACGKLMCCLKYEHPLYQQTQATAPAPGEAVTTPDGPGVVERVSVPGEQAVVRLDADGRRSVCALADVCGSRKAYEQRSS